MPSSQVDVWSLPTQKLFSSANRIPLADLHIQLSEREAQLKREIEAIRAFRNTIAPINRLPPELLSTIFTHLSHISPKGNRSGSRPLAWMDAALSVCDYWRNTALHCPALWSTVGSEVFAGGLALLESVLSRSGNAPLKVECTSPRPPLRRVGEVRNGLYKLLATHKARLQTLKIVNTHNARDSVRIDIHRALNKLGGGAPMLKALVVEADNCTSLGMLGDLVPEQFLQGGCRAPLLEQLSLTGCKLSRWEALPLGGGNMKNLCLWDAPFLEFPPPEPHDRPTATEFLRSLAQMPLLETLKLSRYLPLDEYPSTSSIIPVLLPRLQNITINDKTTSVVSFMGMIRAKNMKAINIRLLDDLPDASVLVAFLKAFRTLLDGSATSAEELVIYPDFHDIEDRRHEFKFTFPRKKAQEGSPASESSTPSAIDASKELVLQVSCHPGDSRGVDTLFPAIMQTINLSWLTHLSVETQPTILDSIPPYVWSETFGRLPRLQDITLLGQAALSFLHALRDRADDASDEQGAGFGALVCVTIEESFRFDDKKVEWLIEAISSRQTIKRLRLIDCDGLTRAHDDMVRKALPNVSVEWDEI